MDLTSLLLAMSLAAAVMAHQDDTGQSRDCLLRKQFAPDWNLRPSTLIHICAFFIENQFALSIHRRPKCQFTLTLQPGEQQTTQDYFIINNNAIDFYICLTFEQNVGNFLVRSASRGVEMGSYQKDIADEELHGTHFCSATLREGKGGFCSVLAYILLR